MREKLVVITVLVLVSLIVLANNAVNTGFLVAEDVSDVKVRDVPVESKSSEKLVSHSIPEVISQSSSKSRSAPEEIIEDVKENLTETNETNMTVSDYTIQADVNVTGCMNLTTANYVYELNQSLSGNQSNGICIDVQADNITLDCMGIYNITGKDVGQGVATTQYIFNFTLQNCYISNYSIGAYMYNVQESNFLNSTFNSSVYGLEFDYNSSNHYVDNCIFDSNEDGIRADWGTGHILSKNITVNNSIFLANTYGVHEYHGTNIEVLYSNFSSGHIAVSGSITLKHSESTDTISFGGATLYNNTIHDTGGTYCISMTSSANLSHNTIYNCDRAMYIYQSSGITVEYNNISDSSIVSLTDRSSRNNVFTHNTVFNGFWGFRELSPAVDQNNTYTYNNVSISGYVFYGMQNGTIVNNTVTSCNYAFVGSNSLFEGNNVSGCGGGAISFSNSILRNNRIFDNGNGIYLATNYRDNQIYDNEIYNNSNGVYLVNTYNNNISNNNIKNNTNYDFYFIATSTANCNNVIQNNNGTGDLPISFYNSSTTDQDKTVSQLILCNADGSNFTNITMYSDIDINNNTLLMYLTDNSNITGFYSEKKHRGSEIHNSENNTFKDWIITESSPATGVGNRGYGINMTYSDNNVFDNITLRDGYYGITTLYSNLNNYSNLLIEDSGYLAFLITSSDNNTVENSTIRSQDYGIDLEISDNNDIYNVTFFNNSGTSFFDRGNGQNNTVNYCNFSSGSTGVYVKQSDRLLVVDSNFTDMSGDGVYTKGTAAGASSSYYTNVTGCRFDNVSTGIYLYLRSYNASVTNNFVNHTTNGVYAYGSHINVSHNNLTGSGHQIQSLCTNCTFSHNNLSGGTYNIGIYMNGGNSYSVFENNILSGAGTYSVYSVTSPHVYFYNNTVYDKIFYARTGAYYQELINNTFYNAGVNLVGSTASVIDNNKFYNSYLYNTGASSNLTNNYINGSYAWIGASTLFENNTIENSPTRSIRTAGSNSRIINNTLRNGCISPTIHYGAIRAISTNTTIINNTITGHGCPAIHTIGDSYEAYGNLSTFEGNTIFNNTIGMKLKGDSGLYMTIIGNNISHNSKMGIYMEGLDDSLFQDNNVTSNTQYGFYLFSTAERNNITGNRIENNTQYGFYIVSSNNNTVDDNTVYDNHARGMYVQLSDWNNVTNNNVTSNVDTGIYLVSSDNNTIDGNDLYFNPYAIEMSSSVDNNISNNNLVNNTVGVYFTTSNNNIFTNNTVANSTTWAFNLPTGNSGNLFYNQTVSSYPTPISFTYGGSVNITGVTNAPTPDPLGYVNLSKYINATNTSAGSWLHLNFSYTDADVLGLNENGMLVLRHNGSWETDTSVFASSYGVNVDDNYGYANITGFNSIFAPEVPITELRWIKTYTTDGTEESYFGVNQTAVIKVKLFYENVPTIVIKDENGTVVSSGSMENETALVNSVAIWNYSFTPNVSGWFDIEIASSVSFKDVIYADEFFQSEWVDFDGNQYPFRIKLNLSESNLIERYFEPISMNINFSSKANPNSVRLVMSNTTHYLEIPSGIYNTTSVNEYIDSGTIVWLATMPQNENKTFYVYYSRSDLGQKDYNMSINVTNTSGDITIENNYYKVYFGKVLGGAIKEIVQKDFYGGSANLSESNMQLSPEISDGINTYRVIQQPNPTTNLTNKTNFVVYTTSSSVGTSFNYDITYTMFANVPFIIIETNITPKGSGSWTYYDDQKLILKDGLYTNSSWRNSTGVFDSPVIEGNGADNIDIGNADWIGDYGVTYTAGIIFLNESQSKSYTPQDYTYDTSSFEQLERKQYSGTVAASDYFYSKTAFVLWDPSDDVDDIDNTSTALNNPLNYFIEATTETNDVQAPQYTYTNITFGPVNDNQDISCWTHWTDNLELDYAKINITSPGYNNVTTVLIGQNDSWVNVTVDSSDVEAGIFQCNITAYDIAGQTNSTVNQVSVGDLTPPTFTNIINEPSNNATLDPGVQVNVTANIIEYTGNDTAILQYRNQSGTWVNITMDDAGQIGYVFNYTANFTADSEDNWEYKIYANDTSANSNTSTTILLPVLYDWTWELSPSELGAVSGSLGENITLGDLTINNSGDKDLLFTITSNWDNKDEIFYDNNAEGINGYTVSIAAATYEQITVIATAKTNERSDDVTITVDAFNSSAVPSSNQTNATVVSTAGGPFMLVTITDYNVSVTQEDTDIYLRSRLQNKGNETATGTWLAFTLPSGWTITTGSENVTVGDLPVNSIVYNELTVNIDSDAPVGSQILTSVANCTENKTGSDSVSVFVNNKTTTQNQTIIVPGPGGGGSGGAGGSGGTGGLTEEEKREYFQTEDVYELVSGKTKNFTFTVNNQFDGDLSNVTVNITGFLAQYLRIEPESVNRILENRSYDFTVFIEAPAYFTAGKHELIFEISGDIVKTQQLAENVTVVTKTKINETRNVLLIITEISREEAASLIIASEGDIGLMNSSGFNIQPSNALLLDAKDYFDEREYDLVKETTDKITQIKKDAYSTSSLLEEVNELIAHAKYNGISVPETIRLERLTQFAFDRGAYDLSLKRAEDAKLTYALETSGKFNVISFIQNNTIELAIASGLIGIGLFITYIMSSMYFLDAKIIDLKREEKVILGLIKETQKETFEQGKLSMEEYTTTSMHYNERLNEIVEEIIKTETIKSNLLRFAPEKKRLIEEREKLVDMLKDTQRIYMQSRKIEAPVYQNKMKSYRERISEIDERISTIEANEVLKSHKSTGKVKTKKVKK